MADRFDISHLTPAERFELIDTLWNSLAADESLDSLPVPPKHQAEVNRRLEMLESGEMGPGEAWEAVSKRLWKQ